jgi:hypothetical protein
MEFEILRFRESRQRRKMLKQYVEKFSPANNLFLLFPHMTKVEAIATLGLQSKFLPAPNRWYVSARKYFLQNDIIDEFSAQFPRLLNPFFVCLHKNTPPKQLWDSVIDFYNLGGIRLLAKKNMLKA